MSSPSRVRLMHVTTVPMSLTFLRGQVKHMRECGLEVHALSSPGPELDAFGERYGVPTHAVPMARSITPLRDLAAVREIRRVMGRVRPAIVHAHTPKGGLLGMLGAWAAGVPVRVYHMRGLPMMGATGARREMLRRVEQLSCLLAHRVLCVSRSIREVAIAEGLCPPDKIRVLAGGSGQGVDALGRFNPRRLESDAGLQARARLGIPEEAVVLGFVGRLVRDKGVVELAQAWEVVRAEHPSLHLLLVGPLEPQDPVPPEVERALREDPRVHMTGLNWDTPPLYAAMDVVTLPSYREGFPNVPLEAAAMELPVVATRVPGCMDAVVDGATGTLVRVRDAAALAAAVRRYLDDAALGRAHGRAGRQRVVREFRPEVIHAAITGEYVELLRSRGIALPMAVAAAHPESGPAVGAAS